jgi:photosystem II stability/assembly factor-like uncharacterized protein
MAQIKIRIALLISLAAGLVLQMPVQASTVVTNGPYGGEILQLSSDAQYGNRVFAVAKNVGLFYSGNGADSWQLLFSGTGSEGNFASSLRVRSDFYVVREGYGIYRSTDSGGTWTQLPLPNDFSSVTMMRVFTDPLNENVVYAAFWQNQPQEKGGLFKSTNKGDSWNLMFDCQENDTEKINAFTISSNNYLVLYLGTEDGKLFMSVDQGTNWTLQDFPVNHISDLVYYKNAGLLYAIGAGEGQAQPTTICQEMETKESPDHVDCYGGGSDPHYLLIDSSPTPNDNLNTIYDLKIDENTLLAATRSRPAISTDGGANWDAYVGDGTPIQTLAVAFDTSNASYLYAGNQQGVYKTTVATNFSGAWLEKNEKLTGVVPFHIENPENYSNFVLVGSNSGMFLSVNNGDSWERQPAHCDSGGNNCYVLTTPFVIDHNDVNVVVQAGWQSKMNLSADLGATWTESDVLPPPTVLPALEPGKSYLIDIKALSAVQGAEIQSTRFIAAAGFHNPDDLNYSHFQGGGIYISDDGGEHWSLVYESANQAILSLAGDPHHPLRVYAGACALNSGQCEQGWVLNSSNRGNSWATLLPSSTALADSDIIVTLAVNPQNESLVAAYGNALVQYSLGDSDWVNLGASPVQVGYNQILFDPNPSLNGQVLYIATSEGLLVSTAGGSLPVRHSDPLLGYANSSALAASVDSGQTNLYLGVAGGEFASSINTLEADNATSIQAISTQLIPAGVYRAQGITSTGSYIFLPFVKR